MFCLDLPLTVIRPVCYCFIFQLVSYWFCSSTLYVLFCCNTNPLWWRFTMATHHTEQSISRAAFCNRDSRKRTCIWYDTIR